MNLCAYARCATETTNQPTGPNNSAADAAPAYTDKPPTPHHAEKAHDAGTRQPNRTPPTTAAPTAEHVTSSSLPHSRKVHTAPTAESYSPERTQPRITSSNDHEADPTQSVTSGLYVGGATTAEAHHWAAGSPQLASARHSITGSSRSQIGNATSHHPRPGTFLCAAFLSGLWI
jgi:hypothetical protein